MSATKKRAPLCEKAENIFDALCGQGSLLESIRTLPSSSEIESIVRALEKVRADELGTLLAAHVKKFEELQEEEENDRLRSTLDSASLCIESCSKLLGEVAAYEGWTVVLVSKTDECWRLFCSYITTVSVLVVEDTDKQLKFFQINEARPVKQEASVER